MATWGSYFSSYVKKRDEGTLIPVESPEDANAESIAPRKVNAGVQRSNTTTKKLYGATIEENSAESLKRSGSNAARVAKLFGYANAKPSLAQVVEDAVKQKAELGSESEPEPAVEKFKYIPITQSIFTSPTVKQIIAPVSPQTASEEKPDPETNYVPITSSLPKESIAKTVAKMSSQAIATPEVEAKETSKSEPIPEPTQFKPIALVSAKPLSPTIFQSSTKVTKPKSKPQAPVTPEEEKVQFIPIMYSMPKEEVTVDDSPFNDSTSDDVEALPTEPRKKPLPRKDSMFSQHSLTRSNTQRSSDDVTRELDLVPAQLAVERRTASSDPAMDLNNPQTHTTKISLDELMLSIQPVTEQPKATNVPKAAERSKSAPRSRAVTQSISESLDNIMVVLQAEIVPELKKKHIAAVVVQKPTRSPPSAITNIATELPAVAQRGHRSASTTSRKRAPSPSIEEILTEVPEPEEETTEVVESRAWEHARKISEFKLQQELFEKERQRMAEEQLKFQAMEAKFKEESEQQKMFVEDVRREQEREAAEALEKIRIEQEILRAEAAESARLREEAAIMKREAEAAFERIESEKRLKEDAEESRVAVEQERNRLAWEAEKERNAAEIAKLIAAEEERERMEMEQLELIRTRNYLVPPTPRRQRDLDEASVYSDELVESDDDSTDRLEEERMNEERRREEEKLEYEREMKEAKLRDQREEDDRVARRKKKEEQDRREQLRYEKLEAERIRAQEEEMEEDLRRFEIEDEERIRREEEEERLRFELQQDDEQRRIDEQKAQKLQFEQEQLERREYAAAEAERQRLQDEQARIDAEEAAAQARLAEEKRKAAEPFQKEQNFWAERKRLAVEAVQASSGKSSPLPRSPSEEVAIARQAEADEERRIEEIAARMEAEDEAAEAAATKAEELRKAEEKIKMAFASMAAQKAGGPPPTVPIKQDEVGPVTRSASRNDGPAVPAKAVPPRIIGKMRPPPPAKRSSPVTTAPADIQAPTGVTRYNTVAGGPRELEKTSIPVARGNTVTGRPAGFPRGLPSGPRAGLPSGPRPKRN